MPKISSHSAAVLKKATSDSQAYVSPPARKLRVAQVPAVLDYAQQDKQNYLFSELQNTAHKLNLPLSEMGSILKIAPATLTRRKDKELDFDESDRFYRLSKVHARAQEVLDSPAQAASWLRSNIASLGGMRPLDLIATTPGYERVLNVLNAIDYGVTL